MDKNTEKIIKRYNRTARYYGLLEKMMDKGRMKNWRKDVWMLARGKVLEVGVGTGNNMQYYPPDVEVTAIDFSDKMLEKARIRAQQLNIKVDLLKSDVQDLEFDDEVFDTVITTCVFCSVPDPIKGLKEISRVCKKDGSIIMLEHVRSNKKFIGVLMDLFNPVIVRIVGANINRNTIENLRKAGITVDVEKNLLMDIVKHILCHVSTPG